MIILSKAKIPFSKLARFRVFKRFDDCIKRYQKLSDTEYIQLEALYSDCPENNFCTLDPDTMIIPLLDRNYHD